MNIVGKNIVSLFRNTSFRMCETKVENKIGYIYMNSPKDFNALSFDMKKSLVQQVEDKEDWLKNKVQKNFDVSTTLKFLKILLRMKTT